MLPVPHPTTYPNQDAYGHPVSERFQYANQRQRRPLFYPPTPEQPPMPQAIAPTSTFPPPRYHQQPLSVFNNPPQHDNLPPQNLAQFDDISPAFMGKAFIYDCMVRALESLNPDGASVTEIFDTVWRHSRPFILARSREGDTEASRRVSTRNTIVNYLSTSPAFINLGRNRWVLTGKRHGINKRGGKISLSRKRRPRKASSDDFSGTNAAAPSSSNPSSPATSSAGHSSSSSPAISQLPYESASTPSVLHHTHDPESHQHHQHHQRQEGPIVSSLSSHAAPSNPDVNGIKTVVTAHLQQETFLYGQSAHDSTSNTANWTVVAPTTGGDRKRSFAAVPQVLPPLPQRTWYPDSLEPFAKPIQTSTFAPAPTTFSTTTVYPPFTAPSGRLFQIPSNTSYYEAPSAPTSAPPPPPQALTSYMNQEHNPCTTVLPPPSSFSPPYTLEQVFVQVDHRGGCAGNSIPGGQQHYYLHHQQQTQVFRDHDPFANPPGLV